MPNCREAAPCRISPILTKLPPDLSARCETSGPHYGVTHQLWSSAMLVESAATEERISDDIATIKDSICLNPKRISLSNWYSRRLRLEPRSPSWAVVASE